MSVFSRIAKWFKREPPKVEAEPQQPAPVPEETAASRAAHAVVQRDYADALQLLREARGHVDEASVVDAITLSLPEEAPEGASSDWDALVLALGDVLVARGDRARACDHLKRARTPAARVLRADLLCEGDAPAEDLDLALALYAEALREDLDAPGARERWERLRRRLGRSEGAAQPSMGATLLGPATSLPFTLVREVARGGSAVVYEATAQLVANRSRTIALKIAHQRTSARSWLTHEARIAVRFRGPGVVPIFDVDPEEGWLAMAWAAGGSLRARLRRGPVDPAFLDELLGALADVHREGFVHGDLKPANVLFDAAGRPWLGDFALARPFGDANTPGSAGYVSPERRGGAPCDPRDDVFAIGKIVEDLLTERDDANLRAFARACIASDRPKDAGAVRALFPRT